MFDTWGRFVYRHRGWVLTASALLLVLSLFVLTQGGTLHSFQTPENTQSGEGALLMQEQLGSSEATFVIVFSHPTLTWRDAAFKAALLAAVAPLDGDASVEKLLTVYDVPAGAAGTFVSTDGHRTLVTVTMAGELTDARDAFPPVREKLRSTTLDIKTTDRVAVYSEIEAFLAQDLKRAEFSALPLTLILLLLVFGSVVAALLPLGVGLLAVAGGIAGVLVASRFTDMSVYAMNIVTLIGLGVAIDYSLFIVSRFREELKKQPSTQEALALTMATAGRATAFSGLTVAVGLAGLAFYKGLFFASVGIAGAIVVALAVFYALTFLAALLAMLGPRVDMLRVPLPKRRQPRDVWGTLARGVMRRPLWVLLPTLAFVLIAGAPFLQLEMGSGGLEALPAEAESRQGWEILKSEFPGTGRNVISVVIEYPGDPLTRQRVGGLYDFTRDVGALDGVLGVESIVDLDPRFTKEQYQDLYAQPRVDLAPPVQEAMNRSAGTSIVVVAVKTGAGEASPEARRLVDDLRALVAPADGRVLVTGPTAIDADSIALVYKYTPMALLFVIVTTYFLLLVQTGSILLPAKAIVMNFLSIAASFGALVWIFQQGNLSAILDFTPAPIDPSLPVLLFCIVFGLSMDYEVLMLSRMHEEWDRTHDNQQAVAAGLAKCGKLITSAAAIMVVVFGAFAVAQVTIIKAIGLGLALAIAIDATLVRALVVPATMRLMGNANWWAPKWLSRFLKPLQH
jgi:RND superfamily putative drug exporter